MSGCTFLTGSVLIIALTFVTNATAKGGGYGDYDNYDDIGGPYHNNFVPVVKKVVDYYSKPKYAFGYEVDGLDPYYKELSHGRWEIRDGDVTQGQYRVLLPDGRIQIVSYIADKFGYRPTIQYINKGVLPPPPPAYANVKIPAKYIEHQPIVPVSIPTPVFEKVHIDDFQHHPPAPVKVHPVPLGPVLPPFAQYGAGYGYGGGYGDPFLALGSGRSIKRVAKKRPLLYDRTLFRKDVERRRRSDNKAVSKAT